MTDLTMVEIDRRMVSRGYNTAAKYNVSREIVSGDAGNCSAL